MVGIVLKIGWEYAETFDVVVIVVVVVGFLVGGVLVVLLMIIGKMVDDDVFEVKGVVINENFEVVFLMLLMKLEEGVFLLKPPPGK